MSTLHPYVCGVIPPHILNRLAEDTDQDAREQARRTLVDMSELAFGRDRTLVPQPPPAPAARRKLRHVYDARRRRDLPGKLVMSNHRRRGTDIDVNEAYDGAGATYDFFADVFGRHSIDGQSMRIDATVHYGTRFENAVWNGRQIVFGDGDGRIFNRFTASLEVIAHELAHGVTQHASALGYTGESGALNEHLSDAFGVMVKQYTLGQTVDEADWLIGAQLLGPGVKGKGVRSLAAPGTAYDDPLLGCDPQPAHMSGFVETADDSGAVHINSGIPNHAFYLAAKAIGGESWTVLGRIWYATVTSKLRADTGFYDFAKATVDVAGELYGLGGTVQRIVADAWSAVGIPLLATPRLTIRRCHPRSPALRAPKWRQRPFR